MTKADFVSFRPGDLSAELLKRADAADMSTSAKGLLRETFAMLRAESALLQKVFSPAEMQVIVAALYDSPCEPEQVISRLSDSIDAGAYLVDAITRRYRLDKNAFLEKVRTLSPAATFVIADSINRVRRLPMIEVFGLNGMPSQDALRCVGLVAAQGPVAWGFCVVRAADLSCTEYVLGRDPSVLKLDSSSLTIDELAMRSVELARLAQAGQLGPDADLRGYWMSYQLAVKTGWRFFRVEENKDGMSATVVEIKREALISDLRDGSLHHGSSQALVLAGLNAPDYDATSAESTAPLESTEKHRTRAARRKADAKAPSDT